MRNKKIILTSVFFLLVYFFPRNIFSDNIQKADKYYEQYDYKLALAIYEKVMQKKPSLEVAQKIANCYRFINDAEGAEQAYRRVLDFEGADPVNYKYYADALKQNGKFGEARAAYVRYGKQFPAKAQEAEKLANETDVARMWNENPDPNVHMSNMAAVNSANSDFSPVSYAGGMVFTSDRWFVKSKSGQKSKEVYGWTGNPYLKLYYLPGDKGEGAVEMLPRPLNEELHNGPAVFSAGSDTIYFTRTEAPSSRKNRKLKVISKKIYYSVKRGETWDTPKPVSLNSTEYSIQHPALSPDGSLLYFASDMPGGRGGMDIYVARKQADGSWALPQNCGPNINGPEDEVFPQVRKDGRFYFASKGHIGMGGLDIFTAEGSGTTFSLAENLKAPMNSTRDDFGIFFKDDLNGYLSSNRAGGMGLDDIYSFAIDPASKQTDKDLLAADNKPAEPIFAIEGRVVDKATKQALPNTTIYLINKATGQESTTISDAAGNFNFTLQPGMDYSLSGSQDKFYSRQEGQVTTLGLKTSTIFTVTFELTKAEDAYIVKLKNIYYDFNKWAIRPDAARQLNKVVNFLNTVPASQIELRSHTDSRGKAAYNKWLSQKRAQSAVDYLVARGVGSTRLTAVGMGETELLNRCSDGVACTAQEHAMNRRTEFKITKVPVASSR